MELIVNKKKITAPILDILDTIKYETNSKLLRYVRNKGEYISINCPVHNNGNEQHPSCGIYANPDGDVEYGRCHCFACGLNISLDELVNIYFNEKGDFGKEWLAERFGNLTNPVSYLPSIELTKRSKEYLNPESLIKFKYYSPYLESRGISKEIQNMFSVGFDPIAKAVTFPVFDEHNNLVMITKRSVESKQFYIDKDKEKPVYLLNHIINNSISKVYLCESQINALTLWTWGYPAIALIGTGSKNQYEILNKSGIREYILCFDGDEAGDKGITRFIKNIRKDVFISIKKIPRGKDINDLNKAEFEALDTVLY